MIPVLDGRGEATRLLDDLFRRSREHRGSEEFIATIEFLARFRSQKPYNAFLLRVQKPGVKYALTAHQWQDRHRRGVRDGARPLIVLVPYGPVALAYDLEDTDGPDLPPDLLEPFAVTGRLPPAAWDCLTANARAARVAVLLTAHSWLQAGEARRAAPGDQRNLDWLQHQPEPGLFEHLPPAAPPGPPQAARYVIEVDEGQSLEERFVTLAHELAHVLCGHLGKTAVPREPADPWPDRRGLDHATREFEAESAAYLVARRAGLEPRSAEYLAGYHDRMHDWNAFSFDAVLRAAGKIEGWAENPPKRRKDR